ncbi:Exodeoxyribonuclease III [Streptomyces sp. SudanB91_2054]
MATGRSEGGRGQVARGAKTAVPAHRSPEPAGSGAALSVPPGRLWDMRIATWNVNSITARLPRLLAWLESSGTDVLCLQEAKVAEEQFPFAELREAGYEAAVHATGRWNGVAVLSRVGLDDVVKGLPGDPGYDGVQEPRAISATCGPVRVWSVYVPNGREVDHPHYAYKLQWFEALRAAVEGDAAGSRPFAVMGDYNVAPTDDDVYDRAAFEGSTHVTPAERAALASLRGAGLSDVVPRPLKYDHPYTYWDYRQLCFPKNRGMRIDLVYGNETFAKAVTDSYVDREERKGKGASDHAPVVVDLDV